MLGVALVYVGFLMALAACVSALFRFRTGKQALLLLGAGLAVTVFGWILPASDSQITTAAMRLDEFAPVYQFNEIHSVEVAAPRERVYRAIKEVKADDILFFRTLVWLRRLGRPGPESILNAPERIPILEVATRTTFLLLAEEPGREIVVGTIVLAPPGARWTAKPTPQQYKALDRPGFAKALMNFRVEDAGAGSCVVRTETRVYATDASSRRRFAAYWRTIYPGSAVIRRMWLWAIRLRAESGT